MHLKRIELTNYRQHRELDLDFDGNLIAIVAKNGAGKSNLLGAIQFALTGEHPGATKSDLTTWGEKEGSVRLFFTAGSRNEEFVITRKTNGDVTLKVCGETIKQARKVEEALREKAGLDKELIRQIVFVPQKGIDSILFDDPKNREVAFQRLIGIGNASKIYESLRTEIAAYDKPQGFDEAIERSRQQLIAQEGVARTCRNALEKYDEALKTLPSKEALESEVDKCAGAQQAIDAYIRAKNALADAKKKHDDAKKMLANMGSVPEEIEAARRKELEGWIAEKEKKSADLESGKESLRFLNRMKELADAMTIASERYGKATCDLLKLLDKYPTKLEDDKAEMDRLVSEHVAAMSELKSLKNLVSSASSDGTCPVCGAPASQEDIEAHLKERIAEAEKKASEASEKAEEFRRKYNIRKTAEDEARENEKKEKNAYDIALAALQKAKDANVEGVEIDVMDQKVSYKGKTPEDIYDIEKSNEELMKRINSLQTLIGELRKEVAGFDANRSASKEARDNVAKLSAQIGVLEANLASCGEKLNSLGIIPESIDSGDVGALDGALKKARSNLDAYNGILRDMAGTKGQLEAAEKTIESTRKFINDLVEKKELEDKVKAKVDVLKRVRDGLHYRELPRIMSQNVMRDLTACVNSYLDQFNAPFVVEAEEEGFGFRCCFIDGRTMPDPHPDASMLSGGQKVALAIAFRMAIYMCFGGELGLLSLDEPTAYLDEASIGHLGELLEKVGTVARNKGLQILMATHEKAIMPFLDTKIDLDAMKNQ